MSSRDTWTGPAYDLQRLARSDLALVITRDLCGEACNPQVMRHPIGQVNKSERIMKLDNNHHLHYAIYEYLSPFYFKGYEGLGGFLGSLAPAADGTPMDSALIVDIAKFVPSHLVLDDKIAFQIMIKFLKFEANLGWEEINEFLEKENLNNVGNGIPPAYLVAWHVAIKKGADYEFDFE